MLPSLSTDRMLRQHHRWARLAWPLLTMTAGLAITLVVEWRRHPSLRQVDDWANLMRLWAMGLGLTLLAAAGVWFIRRNSLLHSARRLDERLDARNRLETAALLRGDAGALASAQRAEAAAFLERQPEAGAGLDPLLWVGAAVAALLLSHLFTLLSWSRPWLWTGPKAVTPAAAALNPPAGLPRASIRWKSPESETKATPIEEVPLAAMADSTGGLRDLVLEIAVNGQPRLSVPVPGDALKTAGAHPVEASIYLDQVEVQPFDMVSYYLRAQRIDPRKLPETASSVQFVQVKPFRSDVKEMKGGEGFPIFALITALKVAQLRLIKQNFVLGHTDLSQDSPEWKTQNAHVGSEQGILQTKTAEAVTKLIEESVPPEVVNLLNQAQPFMGEASRQILSRANQPALTPQGKALSLITEVEKFGIKLAPHGGTTHGSKPSPTDPFRDKQQFEMKQRFQTAGGELEMLAAAQAKLADDLARPEAAAPTPAPAPDAAGAPPDPMRIEGTPGERQTQISQRVGALLTGRIFKPEIVEHLEKGRDRARDSLRQIDAGDNAAAREPAAGAARELQLAADAMNRAGEEQAKLELADAQSQLNEAAQEARDTARQPSDEQARKRAEAAAEQARRAATDLAAEAKAQQETGSSKAAGRLNDLAKAISAEDTRKLLEQLRAQPHDAERAKAAADHLEQLASQAVPVQGPGPLSPAELAQLADRLERARTNMQRLAAGGAHPESLPTGGAPVPAPQTDPKAALPGSPPPGNDQGQGECKQPGAGTGQSPGKGQGQSPTGQGNGTGQGNAPGQGTQPGEGNGSASNVPGKSPSSAPGTSHSPDGSRGHGSGESTSASGGPSDGLTEPPRGDTYGTHVGEQQTGAIPRASGAPRPPTYTDHAARAVETRDPQSTREEFARELIEEVREDVQQAATVAPKAEALDDLRDLLREVPVELHAADQAALFARIDPPLLGLIHFLRAAAPLARREHQLTAKDVELAPAAYRAAVADYFEQLSRDYDGASPAPKDKKE